jgi:hypothetical protein
VRHDEDAGAVVRRSNSAKHRHYSRTKHIPRLAVVVVSAWKALLDLFACETCPRADIDLSQIRLDHDG